MPWGSVNITFVPAPNPHNFNYNQNYKRQNVVTHTDAANMVSAAVADAVARITAARPGGVAIPGPIVVVRNNISQNMPNDPGNNYRPI